MVNVVDPDGSLSVDEPGALTKISAASAGRGRAGIATRVPSRQRAARQRRNMSGSKG
jgi:hypothetical protein